jgi:sugar phosphate isomerase/epimerase
MIDAPTSQYLSWTLPDITSFLQHAKNLNICLPTTAVSIFNGDDALVTTKGRLHAISLIRQSLAFTALTGAKIMLLCTYFASNPDNEEKKRNLIETLWQIEPAARDLDVAIALESPLSANALAHVVDSIKSKYIGVYYDVGNSIFLGYDPAKELRQLNHRVMSMHLKDTAKNLGDSHLGFGRLNLDEAMAALDEINYGGWLIVETPSGNDDALRNDINIVKQYLK